MLNLCIRIKNELIQDNVVKCILSLKCINYSYNIRDSLLALKICFEGFILAVNRHIFYSASFHF